MSDYPDKHPEHDPITRAELGRWLWLLGQAATRLATLGGGKVEDGAPLLHLVRADETPPPPAPPAEQE